VTEFDSIYRAYFDDVFLYIKNLSKDTHLAEEITSETFFKAMNSIDKFRGDCDIRVWLCQIAKNSYYSYLKKHKRFTKTENLEISAETNIENDFSDKNDTLHIHKILHTLPDSYKEVFSLRIFGELSFKQIGNIFNTNENWACVTFHRAKEKIKKKMEEYNND